MEGLGQLSQQDSLCREVGWAQGHGGAGAGSLALGAGFHKGAAELRPRPAVGCT